MLIARRRLKAVVMRLHDSMIVDNSMIVDKGKFVSAIGALVGSIVLLIGVYLFVNRVVFLAQATSSSAPIASVSREYVSKGKGSVLAYVPTVQIRDSAGRTLELKVDTFNEEPIYIVGQQMRVSCNPQHGCVEDRFFSKWGGLLIVLLISFLFFSPLLAWKFGLWQPNGEITGMDLQRFMRGPG
jgi:hypothetical protein